MPPHSLFEPVQSVRLCRVQSHATSQSLRACSAGVRLCRVQSHATSQSLTSLFGWCTTLPCSEPCHLTVSYEPVRSVRLRCVQSHATSQSLRACSAGVPCGIQSHATSQSLRACSAGVPCGIQSHATSQSLTSLFGAAYPPYSTI